MLACKTNHRFPIVRILIERTQAKTFKRHKVAPTERLRMPKTTVRTRSPRNQNQTARRGIRHKETRTTFINLRKRLSDPIFTRRKDRHAVLNWKPWICLFHRYQKARTFKDLNRRRTKVKTRTDHREHGANQAQFPRPRGKIPQSP